MQAQTSIEKDNYRDHLGNVSGEGKRIWIYPRKPSGWFHNRRLLVSWVLLAIFFVGPFLRYQGDPFLLLNVMERKFIIFGMVFWPQDFHLAVMAMLTFIVMIVLFTAVFGRIWCGWACPQTIFMEMVFRKIEYWIEGDASKQRSLDARPWDTDKIIRKTAKHLVFFGMAFLISNTFLAYIIGLDDLKLLIQDGPMAHLGTFSALLLFTGVFYYVFAKLRELVCIIVCPYGRLQGVLMDKDTMVVAYDNKRGEPRSFLKKKAEAPVQPAGDCVDCKLCVQVCPTGIDIRNGTQLECINCTACMDACDGVMDKINKPRGLIRIDSRNAIDKGTKRRFSPRVMAYSAVLLVLLATFITFLLMRKDLEATLLRAPGQLFQQTGNGTVTNLYSLELVNKTRKTIPISLQLSGIAGELKIMDTALVADPGKLLKTVILIEVPQSAIRQNATPVELHITADGQPLEVKQTTFLGPVKNK